jgi:predicted nucleic acid-binding protein
VRVVADTGPLVAAAHRTDRAHDLAASLVTEIGRDLLVPVTVIVETDQLLRARLGSQAARAFLAAMARGEHSVEFLTPGLFRRAVEIDASYADLDLGFVDASVMALAERQRVPILTFDFEDFRATRPSRGFWRLVVDESRYRDATEE